MEKPETNYLDATGNKDVKGTNVNPYPIAIEDKIERDGEKILIERKTGRTKECYKDARDQLIMQDTIIAESGEEPLLAGEILWIKTEWYWDGLNRKIKLTGDVKTIPQKWTLKSIERKRDDIRKFINSVKQLYA